MSRCRLLSASPLPINWLLLRWMLKGSDHLGLARTLCAPYPPNQPTNLTKRKKLAHLRPSEGGLRTTPHSPASPSTPEPLR